MIATGATGLIIELALFLFPVILVWDLQMRWSSKAIVVVAFSFRLP
jgi:hypothetical protein